MRILVTGVTGFAGGHLAEALLARGQGEVFGVGRHTEWPPEWAHLADRVRMRGCDLAQPGIIEAVLREVQPDQIYHLAGYARVGTSFREAALAWASNLTATLNLYEAVAQWGRPRILYVSSGLVYGDPETADQRFDEQAPLRPTSPYAASKAAADLASYQYGRAPGLPIVRVRPFNHIGPRQSPEFAVAHFAREIAAIALGRQPPELATGDLRPERDLTDVRDMVEAYILLMEQGRAGEAYNAGTGEALSMQAIVDRLQQRAGVKVALRQQADRLRAAEVPALRADAGKLRRETGWSPRHSLDQTLDDTLAYWRARLEAGG